MFMPVFQTLVSKWQCIPFQPFNQLMLPIKEQRDRGNHFDVKIIDLDHVDIAGATKVDQGPVLVITFQTQQIAVVRNSKGAVVEGDPVSGRFLILYQSHQHFWSQAAAFS